MGDVSESMNDAATRSGFGAGIPEGHDIAIRWQALLANDRAYVYVTESPEETQSFESWQANNEKIRTSMDMSTVEASVRNEMELNIETLHKPRIDLIAEINNEVISIEEKSSRTVNLEHLIDEYTQETRIAQLKVLEQSNHPMAEEVAGRFLSTSSNLTLQYLKEHLDDAETIFKRDLIDADTAESEVSFAAIGLVDQYRGRISAMEQHAGVVAGTPVMEVAPEKAPLIGGRQWGDD